MDGHFNKIDIGPLLTSPEFLHVTQSTSLHIYCGFSNLLNGKKNSFAGVPEIY